jgi:phospho-N-acetylmuramoyl-pentapeptide-transferase
MQNIVFATALGVVFAGLGTPYLIGVLIRWGIGSQERVDGVQAHLAKQGTPTMGGLIVIVGSTAAYALTHIRMDPIAFRAPSAQGLIALGTMWALGAVGAADDLISATRRRSLGLSPRAKTLSQAVISVCVTVAVVRFAGVDPSITWTGVSRAVLFGSLLLPVFGAWVFVIVWSMSNAVNVADGTDGLSSGSGAIALVVYVFIAFWEFRHPATYGSAVEAGLLDLAVLGAALLGACGGFLWWNAPPARVILGDTGAMAIGGVLCTMAVFTRTQLLLPIIGGLFVILYASSLLQIAVFKVTRRFWPDDHGNGRRLFAMAPLHHHFELRGWPEVTVTIRFWLIAALFAGFGLALFYMAFLGAGGVD